jgi:NADH-quinone oxidoreductase subunit M
LKDLTRRELAVLLPLVVAIVWLGLFPGPVLRRMQPATQRYVDAVQPHAASTADRLGATPASRDGRP